MLKAIRRIVLLCALLALFIFLFKGWLFRGIVHYEILRTRPLTFPPQGIVPSEQPFELEAAIDPSLRSTSDLLHFTTGKASSDPAVLGKGGPAHCVGYAALFATTLQQRISEAGLSNRYAVEQLVAELHVGRWNLHNAFSSAFWKDHDVVRITDLVTHDRIYIDPTLHDALGIGWVTGPE